MYDNIINVHFSRISGIRLDSVARIHLQLLLNAATPSAGAKQKEPETRINADFPALVIHEASGIRTPDNLIKSQVLLTMKILIESIFYQLRLTLYLTSLKKSRTSFI